MKYSTIDHKQRIAALDGLRGVAALGVLWIHSWTVHGNPRLKIMGIDITSILALGGNGVDLFFVISGFCMYYFYSDKKDFDYGDFWMFLKKRWLRLSPAFYTATVVYVFYNWSANTPKLAVLKILTSVFYLNSLSPYNAEGFFWSLSPEWQFYLIIPLLFIFQKRVGFFRTFLIISIIMLSCSVTSVLLLGSGSDIYTGQLFFRFFEFAAGILVAKNLLAKPRILTHRALWFTLSIIVAYIGRSFLSKPVLSLSIEYYNLFKLVGFTVMSLGFGGIVYLTLTSQNRLKKLIGNPFGGFMGKISYSFYLWHGIIHISVGEIVRTRFELSGINAPLTTFALSTLILIPLSYCSYLLLEKSFFYSKAK